MLVDTHFHGGSKLLGVAAVSSGTGQDAAHAILQLLKSWACENEIIGMCQ